MDRQDPPQQSPQLNVDDPVAMHLLMETAMGDSQQFQVFSYEEIEAIKKELSILLTRIDGTKRKLVLENKLRDAAQSLHRLHDPISSDVQDNPQKTVKRHRGSTMGSRGSFSEILNKTDDELAVSARKCEDLAQELWQLERRAEVLQTMLLEHTAGILQKTHKGFLEKESPIVKAKGINGRNERKSVPKMLNLNQDFDDGSFYQTLDSLLDSSGVRMDIGRGPSKDGFAQYNESIAETERRLEDFNNRLRDAIAQTTKEISIEAVPPLRVAEDGHYPVSALDHQLGYLEKSFAALREGQHTLCQEQSKALHSTEERLGVFNVQLRSLASRELQGQRIENPLPPEVLNGGTDSQLDYLGVSLEMLEQNIQRLSSKAAGVEEANHYKTVLLGLWEILVGGEEDLRRQDPAQRDILNEEFSLQSFSNKVQTLFARATGLQEQKEILARQVEQQRESCSQSDLNKDAKVTELTLELEQARKLVLDKEREATEARDDAILIRERMDTMKQEANHLEQQRGINENKALTFEKEARRQVEEQFLAELSQKQNRLTTVESELAETKDDFGIANAEMLGRLEESEKRNQGLAIELKTSTADRDKIQKAMKDLEAQAVHLQTELTVSKAELDAAYGTRAERAAEATANPVKQQEFVELLAWNKNLREQLESLKESNNGLHQHVETLQKELTETITEYETMTQSTIAFEREREQFESNLDMLRDRCEALETQLSEEKVRWLGVKSPGGDGTARDSIGLGTTSTQVLKNEFKKMMRDTRAENMRALRVSCPNDRFVMKLIRSRSTNKKNDENWRISYAL